MKSFQKLFFTLTMVAVLASCGNDNKSGKKNNGYPGVDAYGINQYGNGLPYQPGVSIVPTTLTGLSVAQVIAENPCITGSPKYITQIQLPNFPATISQGELYVGVTSYGDVGVIQGTGVNTAQFVGYMCQRNSAPGNITGIILGPYGKCQFKQLTAANLIYPDQSIARFRMLEGRNVQNQIFSVCSP